MIKVNLSRIHTMISQSTLDIRRIMEEISRPLAANGKDFVLQILESTTDEDLQQFLTRLQAKKDKISQKFTESQTILEYSFYLRRKLDEANGTSGVALKLLEQNNLKKKLAYLYKISEIIDLSCTQDLAEIKDAAYYKASFTDKQKTYDLPVRMFNEQDYAKIQEEINSTEKAAFKIGDEIAFLNQTTIIEILSFEEYKNKAAEKN